MDPTPDYTLALRASASPFAAAASLSAALLGGLVGHLPGRWERAVPRLSLRHALDDIDPARLRARWRAAGATPPFDVSVYVHGLLVDEQNWTLGAFDLPDIVARRTGRIPLRIRYNTGLHISTNGEALADLLEELAITWGPDLGTIHLVGHSMGGLVCRSALRVLQIRNRDVLNRITGLSLIGTPNHGAELERLAHALERALSLGGTSTPRAIEEIVRATSGAALPARIAGQLAAATATPLRALQSVIGVRSDGIRDLRFGYLVPEEWQGADHDGDPYQINYRRPVPAPEHVHVLAVGGSLLGDPSPAPSSLRTDGLVTTASASGAGPFDDLRLVERGRWIEIPRLLHQAMPVSRRVADAVVSHLEALPSTRAADYQPSIAT